MKHFLYGQVDAIAPTPDMQDSAYQLIESDTVRQAEMNNWGRDFTDRTLYHPAGASINSFNHGIFLDTSTEIWARENVNANFKDIRVSYTDVGRPRCGCHIDRTRNYTLIYLMQSGGPDHMTVFYREHGSDDLIRPPAHRVDHYDQLQEIGRCKLPLNTWMLLNARILHSIENISLGRISIQMGFDDFPHDLKLIDPVYVDDAI